MKLSIIIVGFNTKDYLKQTLNSVFATLKGSKIGFEVIVVDNASTDESNAMVKEQFSQVKLIESKVNLGFGGANNEGAKKAQGEYLFFLNSDTIAPSRMIEKIIFYLDKHPEIAILTPKLVSEDEKTVQAGIMNYKPTIGRLIWEKPFKLLKPLVIKVGFLRKLACKVNLDFCDFNQQREVDWITAAAMFIRKDVFDRLQGFDEKIFMYFEDVDLCLRAKELGAKIVYYPEAMIIHLGGKSISLSKERKKIYYQSQNYFWEKHHSLFSTIIFKIIRFPYQLISLLIAK